MNSLEMVRIEAGFIQPNADFIPAEQALRPNRMRTPLELGMAWIVNLEKDFFINMLFSTGELVVKRLISPRYPKENGESPVVL